MLPARRTSSSSSSARLRVRRKARQLGYLRTRRSQGGYTEETTQGAADLGARRGSRQDHVHRWHGRVHLAATGKVARVDAGRYQGRGICRSLVSQRVELAGHDQRRREIGQVAARSGDALGHCRSAGSA